MPKINPHNAINSVGFPEGQLMGHGLSQETVAEISAAFRLGEPLPQTGNTELNAALERLEQHSAYGKDKGAV